jgi:hypothetical protein
MLEIEYANTGRIAYELLEEKVVIEGHAGVVEGEGRVFLGSQFSDGVCYGQVGTLGVWDG